MLLMLMPGLPSLILPILISRLALPFSEAALPLERISTMLLYLKTSTHRHTRMVLAFLPDLNGVHLRPTPNHSSHLLIPLESVTGHEDWPGSSRLLDKSTATRVAML